MIAKESGEGLKATVSVLLLIPLLFMAGVGHAGIRAPGGYCGVVVFDRWGGCILYSGVYVMYVSEKAKDRLYPYEGKAIQVDATKVYQYMNPGDGRIDDFIYLGPAPADPPWMPIAGLVLKTRVNLKAQEILIEASNTGSRPLQIDGEEFAPTLLTRTAPTGPGRYGPWDGPSFAIVTRESYWVGDTARSEFGGIHDGLPFLRDTGPAASFPQYFTLPPHQTRQLAIRCSLPAGEYDFLCGYGGGVHEYECVASNVTAFDVTKASRMTGVPATDQPAP